MVQFQALEYVPVGRKSPTIRSASHLPRTQYYLSLLCYTCDTHTRTQRNQKKPNINPAPISAPPPLPRTRTLTPTRPCLTSEQQSSRRHITCIYEPSNRITSPFNITAQDLRPSEPPVHAALVLVLAYNPKSTASLPSANHFAPARLIPVHDLSNPSPVYPLLCAPGCTCKYIGVAKCEVCNGFALRH